MAKRRLTPEEETRVEAIRARVQATVGFIETVQDFPAAGTIREVAENAGRRGDLRSLRLLEREVDAMAIALSPDEREKLDALLLDRLGVDKDAERRKNRQNVAAILARGTIGSERERRRLEEYADLLEATGGDTSEILAVRRLLST
jgi:hypothetical protein